MKRYILTLLLISPYFGFSQNLPVVATFPMDSTNNLITYKSIIQLPKTTTDQIYSKVRAWIATAYNSANNVLQMDDKASGTLIAKGIFSYSNSMYPIAIHYTLTINIKPDKFRIVITNYTLQVVGGEETVPLENTYLGLKNNRYAKDETDLNVKTRLIDMLNDIDYKSNNILKSLSRFITDNKRDDF